MFKYIPESFQSFTIAGLILLGGFIVLQVTRFVLSRYLEKSSKSLKVDATQYQFLKNALGFFIFLLTILVIFITIPELRQIGITMFAGAGIFAAIIGFASQAAFSNIVSGVFIVIFKPFRVGDVIQINKDYFGTVEDITLRHTLLRDIENKRYIIPNSVMSGEVIHNFMLGDEKVSNVIHFGIGYSSNIDNAIRVIQEHARKHPNFIDNRTTKEKNEGISDVPVKVVEWAESSIKLRAIVWSEDAWKGMDLKFALLKCVKEAFEKEGIEIPFPHRVIVDKRKKDQ